MAMNQALLAPDMVTIEVLRRCILAFSPTSAGWFSEQESWLLVLTLLYVAIEPVAAPENCYPYPPHR
jgi:hypothetical protein